MMISKKLGRSIHPVALIYLLAMLIGCESLGHARAFQVLIVS